MKLILIGDAHGKYERLFKIIQAYPKDQIIQLGDMGVGFDFTPYFGENFKFIRGNHDGPEECRKHENYLGEFGIFDNVMYIGGAFSVDYEWRQAMMAQSSKPIWWADEQLSPEQLNAAKNLYLQNKPRIVLSHEAPASAGRELLTSSGLRPYKFSSCESRTAQIMQQMFEEHQPDLWVFGHYHISKTFSVGKTRFICLNELEMLDLDTEHPTELPGIF